jgi:hypothetical protein
MKCVNSTAILQQLDSTCRKHRPPRAMISLTLSDEEFSRANERAIATLRQMHPDRPQREIVHALRQSIGLTEPVSRARLVDAALFLLGGA